jgi:hypothetical protein
MKDLRRRLDRLSQPLTPVASRQIDVARLSEVERARAVARLVLRSRARAALSPHHVATLQAVARGPLDGQDALAFLARMRAIREELHAAGRWHT